jgi:hypothetical protein
MIRLGGTVNISLKIQAHGLNYQNMIFKYQNQRGSLWADEYELEQKYLETP